MIYSQITIIGIKPLEYIPYARHYNPRFVYFLPTFWKSKTFFQGGFFRKLYPYVWLVFKSGFYSRAGYDGARTVVTLRCQMQIISWLFIPKHAKFQSLSSKHECKRSMHFGRPSSVLNAGRSLLSLIKFMIIPKK